MSRFRPSQSYQPRLDIRFTGGNVPVWARPLAEGQIPNCPAWLVVMPRRAGKTWLAHALAHARAHGTTRHVDLRSADTVVRKLRLGCLLGRKSKPSLRSGELLLIDEPALAAPGTAGVDPAALAAGLTQVREAGAVPVVFATPAEHALLAPYLGADAPKDVLHPPVLGAEECARMAGRAPEWAPALVQELSEQEPAWLHTPFLLELVLHIAEEHAEYRGDLDALLRTAVDEAVHRHAYIGQWFHNGLAAEHRAALRARRWQSAGLSAAVDGERTAAERRLAEDPVLARHLPAVLRIHHITDLHHGGSLRSNVDAKDVSQAGQRLAALAGAGSPMDSYLDHIRQLAGQDRAPHLVIVTGDLVNRPVDEFGETAVRWLAELDGMLAAHPDLGADAPRIVLVGGNHDVSWDLCLDPEPAARHRWFARVFDGYPHPDLHLADHGERRLYVRYPDAGLRIALLGTAESGGEAARDQDRDRLLDARQRFVAAGDDAAVHELILDFERHDPGVIARAVLDRLAPEPGYVTVAALHHPLSPVPAVEVAPYSGVVNAGPAKRALAAATTSLVLHGHTHLAFFAAERLLGMRPSWTTRIAGAPTLGSRESDEQNGYNEVFIAREGGDHAMALRTVRFDGGQWAPEDAIAFLPGAPDESTIDELCQDRAETPR
ncbi:metallophosphoesterase family protein [Streptomyces sp. NPDC001970]